MKSIQLLQVEYFYSVSMFLFLSFLGLRYHSYHFSDPDWPVFCYAWAGRLVAWLVDPGRGNQYALVIG